MRLPVDQVKPNPDNPRIIKDKAFKKLVQSLKDFPEMAEVREVVLNKDHIILGGNMRFRAMKEAGWKDIPVKIVDWSIEKQREFIVKDNVSGGEWDWDILANEWNGELLADWGLEFPIYDEPDISLNDGEKDAVTKMTFEVADEDVEVVNQALSAAKTKGDRNMSSGEALVLIMRDYSVGS
jgi:ParB-like chromosome segregation protein Spo0J